MFIDYANSRILVTGGAGFMGSHFIDYLLEKTPFQGQVYNFDLLTYAGNLENLEKVAQDKRYAFIKGDVCDHDHLAKVIREEKITLIIHFAAESHVDRSIDQPRTFIETNVIGTQNILDCLRTQPDIHFHFISTDEVYGDLPKVGHFTEASPYKPSSPYAASKAAADHLVLAYARTYGLSVTISHSTNNYGPRQYPEKLMPVVIMNAMNQQSIPIFGNGENIRDWLYVDDHSMGVLKILEKGKRSEVYNVGAGNEYSNLEIIDMIFSVLEKLLPASRETLMSYLRFLPDRPGHDFRYAFDTKKTELELGFHPEITILEGIDKTVRWYLDRG